MVSLVACYQAGYVPLVDLLVLLAWHLRCCCPTSHWWSDCSGYLSDSITRFVFVLALGTRLRPRPRPRPHLGQSRTQLRSGSSPLVGQVRFHPQNCSLTAEIPQCCRSAAVRCQTAGLHLLARRIGSRRQHRRTAPAASRRCLGLAAAGWELGLAAPGEASALVVVGWWYAEWFGG
jgi:hypothetical protein